MRIAEIRKLARDIPIHGGRICFHLKAIEDGWFGPRISTWEEFLALPESRSPGGIKGIKKAGKRLSPTWEFHYLSLPHAGDKSLAKLKRVIEVYNYLRS